MYTWRVKKKRDKETTSFICEIETFTLTYIYIYTYNFQGNQIRCNTRQERHTDQVHTVLDLIAYDDILLVILRKSRFVIASRHFPTRIARISESLEGLALRRRRYARRLQRISQSTRIQLAQDLWSRITTNLTSGAPVTQMITKLNVSTSTFCKRQALAGVRVEERAVQ